MPKTTMYVSFDDGIDTRNLFVTSESEYDDQALSHFISLAYPHAGWTAKFVMDGTVMTPGDGDGYEIADLDVLVVEAVVDTIETGKTGELEVLCQAAVDAGVGLDVIRAAVVDLLDDDQVPEMFRLTEA